MLPEGVGIWGTILAAFGFTSGAYAYANRVSGKAHARIDALHRDMAELATRDDIKRLESQVDRIVDHLLEKK